MGHTNQSLAAKECRRWSDCVPPKVLGQKLQARFFWSIQSFSERGKKGLGRGAESPSQCPKPRRFGRVMDFTLPGLCESSLFCKSDQRFLLETIEAHVLNQEGSCSISEERQVISGNGAY
jgi:hypothetical protein